MQALLTGLARQSRGLCIVTTRFKVADLAALKETAPQPELLRLSREAGVTLLRSIGVEGSLLRPEPTSENPEGLNEFEKTWSRTSTATP